MEKSSRKSAQKWKDQLSPREGTSLEWTVASPPPFDNFGGKHPVVYHDPYQYGVKGAKGDYIMQDSPEPSAG